MKSLLPASTKLWLNIHIMTIGNRFFLCSKRCDFLLLWSLWLLFVLWMLRNDSSSTFLSGQATSVAQGFLKFMRFLIVGKNKENSQKWNYGMHFKHLCYVCITNKVFLCETSVCSRQSSVSLYLPNILVFTLPIKHILAFLLMLLKARKLILWTEYDNSVCDKDYCKKRTTHENTNNARCFLLPPESCSMAVSLHVGFRSSTRS